MIKCGVIQDLLTGYISGTGSVDSRIMVEEHIKTCSDCNNKLIEMQSRIVTEVNKSDATKIKVLKSMKKKMFKKNMAVAIISSLMVLFIVTIVGFKVIQLSPIKYYDGLVNAEVKYVDYYINSEGYPVVITSNEDRNKSIGKIPVLGIISEKNFYSIHATSRIIIRDGEKVRIEYFCFTENTLNKIQSNNQLGEQTFILIHGDSNNENSEKIEVYYVNEPETANKMNDDDYDNYRNTGTLVWSGTLK